MGHLVRTNTEWNTITTHFCCNYGCLYNTRSIDRQQIWKLWNHMIEHYPQTQLKRTTLPSQSVLYVHILIFALNEEAFINHFLKCSRTVCANNAPPSDHYVTIFITHPFTSTQHSFGCFNIPTSQCVTITSTLWISTNLGMELSLTWAAHVV